MSTALNNRKSSIVQAMNDANLDAVLFNPGPTLPYLSGLHFHISERPVLLCIDKTGAASMIVPELESQKLAHAAYPLLTTTYTEDTSTWQAAFSQGLAALRKSGARRVGIEPRSLRVLELRFIEGALPDVELVSCEGAVAALRMQKDEEELALMKQATVIAQKALIDTLPAVKIGAVETDISALLISNLLKHGSGGELPFQPIIAFGANSANPHAVPTDYAAQEGDMILFDWGANYKGYFSDLTRTFALGEPGDTLRRAYEAVRGANEAGINHARAGVTAGSVDDATRAVINEAGFGEAFTHRTGHGLGLEVHEEPYIRAGNTQVLDIGMTFTVEPGVYLNGHGGIRIEDDVVITATGRESLSTLDRSLEIIPV